MYLGSVRFFRHLILAVLVLLIAVPVFFAIRFGIKYNESVSKLTEVQAIVSQHTQSDQNQDQLVDRLSELLNTSFDEQIPTFQQKVDNSVSAQIDALYIQLSSDIENQTTTIKKDLEKSLSDQLEDMSSTQTQILTSSTKNQTAALEQYMNKKLEEKEDELVRQINDSLTNQLSALASQAGGQSTDGGGSAGNG